MFYQRLERKASTLTLEFIGGKIELGEIKERLPIRECREE